MGLYGGRCEHQRRSMEVDAKINEDVWSPKAKQSQPHQAGETKQRSTRRQPAERESHKASDGERKHEHETTQSIRRQPAERESPKASDG